MWRRSGWLRLAAAVAAVLAIGRGFDRGPAFAQAPSRYTFTRIAAHGFEQVVEGSGAEPVAQRIAATSASLDDHGEVAFAHTVDIFALGRNVVSRWRDGSIAQIYGGGFLAPSLNGTGIDGDGSVFLIDTIFGGTHPGDACNGFNGLGCLFDVGRTFAAPVNESRVAFVVNGAHPRLRAAAGAATARLAYWELDASGADRIVTDRGVVSSTSDIVVTSNQIPDLNTAGDVVFMAGIEGSQAILLGRADGPTRALLRNEGRFNAIYSPRIDDAGRVLFMGAPSGAQWYNVYRLDPGSPEPVLVVDGNNGPLAIGNATLLSVNGGGTFVFQADLGVGGPAGIYTGPNPVTDKVVAVDDFVDGRRVVGLQLGMRAINNNGLAGLGQIVFAARLEGDDGFSLYRADPPGSTAANPFMPQGKVAGRFTFPKTRPPCLGGATLFVDPPFAIGYEYTLGPGSPNFESVLPPALDGQNTYELELWNGSAYEHVATIPAGDTWRFEAGGVARFRLMGIDESRHLDVADPAAFVTGLSFVSGDEAELFMTPIPATPEIVLTWAPPAAIAYGAALGDAQLNAAADQPGALTYQPGAGTVLAAGAHTLSARFTPADPALASVDATVLLTVTPAPLTIRAADKTMNAGDPLPPLTAVYEGFVNGDTASSLDTPPTLATPATGAVAGAFPITVTGALDANYAITAIPATLTVLAPAPLACDIDRDRDVDRNDVSLIMAARAITPTPGDPRDANADGAITVVDARYCTVRCTRATCSP
jgi:hypothetical protein